MPDHDQHTEAGHDSHEHAQHGGNGQVHRRVCRAVRADVGSFLTYFPFWREHVPYQASRAFMMAVSCTKAMLVIMFFMHLLWEANWKWVLTIPATFMSMFLDADARARCRLAYQTTDMRAIPRNVGSMPPIRRKIESLPT